MNNTTTRTETYKGLTLRIRKHWSGSTDAFVLYNGEYVRFDSIKSAKSFITSVQG